MLLNLLAIDSSEVVFPSRARTDLDWELMNKLCERNSDFETFVDDVRKDYEVRTIHKSEYDPIPPDVEEYLRRLR